MTVDPTATHALPISIESLFQGKAVEWERLEYKEGWNPESVLHTMCAFANDFHNLGGGYIIVGVEEVDGRPNLPPVGVPPEKLDAIQKEILSLGFNAIQPTYHPLTVIAEIQGKSILVIWVPAGDSRPFSAKARLWKQEKSWNQYIRKQSSTVIPHGEDLQELLELTANIPFDDRHNSHATLGDLSKPLMIQFLQEVGSDLAELAHGLSIEQLGRQMNVVGGPSEAPVPKNIGLMMFNEHPEKFFPATQIDVVYFPSGPGGDKFIEHEYKGPLPQVIEAALGFIGDNCLYETVIKHEDRARATRIWNYPFRAIEEAIANAIYHRSYEIHEPVEVRVTPNELCVLSFPGPERYLSMQDIAAGQAIARRYRNRRIGEFLKELELTEGRATGINKINRAVAGNGSPDPIFETDDDRSYFLVRFPVHPQAGILPRASKGGTRASVGEAPKPRRPDASDNSRTPTECPTSTPLIENLVSVLTGAMRRKQLQSALGISDRKHFRAAYLLPALEGGWIEMAWPEMGPSSRQQEYRLSVKGEELLEIIRSRENAE